MELYHLHLERAAGYAQDVSPFCVAEGTASKWLAVASLARDYVRELMMYRRPLSKQRARSSLISLCRTGC